MLTRDGEPLDPPDGCVGYRVLRYPERGRPGSAEVERHDGDPLIVPPGEDGRQAALAALATHAPGRFQAVPVDARGRAIPGAPHGYLSTEPECGPSAAGGAVPAADGKLAERLLATVEKQSAALVSVVQALAAHATGQSAAPPVPDGESLGPLIAAVAPHLPALAEALARAVGRAPTEAVGG